MKASTRPVVLIPAYHPSDWLVKGVAELLASGEFSAVVCVNDGCEASEESTFGALRAEGADVITHVTNLGKGAALKFGFNYIAANYPDCIGVVTADADGQHLTQDIVRVAKELRDTPHALVMGSRGFGGDVPLRSRFGNLVTRSLMGILTGLNVRDTQTGLRGVPLSLLPSLLKIQTTGYDYEMEALLTLRQGGTEIREVEIATVYIDKNESSSFRPVLDSFLIYFVLLRFSLNSIATALVDYLVFAVAILNGQTLLASIVTARIIAGVFNFAVAKKLVFRSGGGLLVEILKYASLVLVLTACAYTFISYMTVELGWNAITSKLLVETALFIVSFAIQRVFVFSPDTRRSSADFEATDWNGYYRSRKSRLTLPRKITANILTRLIRRYAAPNPSIVELGGGDSCFYSRLRDELAPANYAIVDSSEVGVEKFNEMTAAEPPTGVVADLLSDQALAGGNVVFSVGLIEHFDAGDTAKVIARHFEACSSKGIVVMTYPTPKLPYRIIRGVAETMGVWMFPDERPLQLPEVLKTASLHGELLRKRTNWAIGLTQQVVVFRKNGDARNQPI